MTGHEHEWLHFVTTGWPIIGAIIVFAIAWGVLMKTQRDHSEEIINLKRDVKEAIKKAETDLKEEIRKMETKLSAGHSAIKTELCRKIDGVDKSLEDHKKRGIKLEEETLTLHTHDLMCEPRLLRIEQVMENGISGLKTEVIKVMAQILTEIQDNRKTVIRTYRELSENSRENK